MKNSPRNKDDSSPSRNIITVTRITTPNRPYITRSETATVCTDSFSYREIVQILTGPSMLRYPTNQPEPPLRYLLPPRTTVPTKKRSSSSSSSTIYERRRNQLKINPVRSGLTENIPLTSPDTPLLHDPFSRSGSVTPSPSGSESDVEEREIREKGFYLHPSPSSTPTDPKPQLLSLFPLTSPRAEDSPASST
ncbi:VQ motif-containing protein 13 [Raphanus sativus]|uniref:VQ motif-containing protein 4 n=1 Tax=Raphanus sativus TaxID=3726 RepID=A0A6J0JSI8_RAPSA|nr:VQ motif-containing protein 4 [Raphanus sativus]KAJ4891578.1 VQ motif-containing protein 13 [Raphanus sativus]